MTISYLATAGIILAKNVILAYWQIPFFNKYQTFIAKSWYLKKGIFWNKMVYECS